MEKVKRYYWIKLKTDFFNSDEIDFLLSQKDGCKYIVLYQMLCLQTANNDGELASKVGEMIIPFSPEKIARDTKYFSLDTVLVALELFKKLQLIYNDNDTCLKITGFENMVGSETAWAKQKREQREKQKLLIGQCPDDVLQEIEIELDKDIDLEKEIDEKDVSDGFIFIKAQLEEKNLVQEENDFYNGLFKGKGIYIQNKEYLPEYLIIQIKLYQLAIKRLFDSKQCELIERVTVPILEKVFGNILKSKKIENVVEYYISSLVNELISRR